MEKIKTLLNDKERRREIILYLVFGALTTAVNMLAFSGLILVIPSKRLVIEWILGLNIPIFWYQIANVLAWIVAVSFAYAGNKLFVFKSRNLSRREFVQEALSFFGARVLSLLLFDLAGMSLCVYIFHIEESNFWGFTIAKFSMNVLVVIFNYVASKLVIFKKKA